MVSPTASLKPRPVAGSVDELLAEASMRQPFLTSDSKSGSRFERVVIGGERHIVKHVHVDDDWTMRFNGDVGCHPLQVWESGLMDLAPAHVEHGVVGVARGLGRNGWGTSILMRDLSTELVPPGDDPITLEDHRRFLGSMAALAAAGWGWADHVGLVPLEHRWSWYCDENLDVERQRGWPDPVPRIAADGWVGFAERAPSRLVDQLTVLRREPGPLVDAIRTTPLCFLHGDWKLGNVGTAADGRTVLIDWTYPGAGPVAHDLVWYLALNRSRLPESKEDAVASLGAALRSCGIDTATWYERQVQLCLLGGLVEFGWEKALGDADELGWWCDRAAEGFRLL
ncbi:MAG: phosphotransferase [Acidimicrobiales bacterium]